MSNRLTFSLASLILIFALAFVAMPAMAATGGPTVTITEYRGAEDPNTAPHATTNAPHKQERADFRLLVTFNALVADDLIDSEFTVRVAEAIGKAAEDTSTSGIGTIVAITRGANAGKSFMVPVDLTTTASSSHTADAYSFGYISFVVNADAVDGTQAGHSTIGIGNVASAAFELTTQLPKANDWTFTPTLGDTADDYIEGGKLKTTKTFDVKFTSSGGTGAVPTLNNSQIQLKDKDGELIDTSAGSITAATPVPVGLVTTVTYTVGGADVDTPVTVGVNPNWAAGSTLRIPAASAPTPDTVDPTVDIELFGIINEVAKTFEVKFTFVKADVTGMANKKAADVPDELMEDQITLQKQDPDDSDAMIDSDAYVQPNGIIKTRTGVFLVTVNYRADALPVYVGLGATPKVSATTLAGETPGADDPKALKVGGTPGTMPPPANAPAKPAAPTAAENATNDLIIDVSWTAPADNGSAITGYTVKKYNAAGTVVKTFPADDPATATITGTSYMVGPVPASDRGMSFTFTVTATNANGDSAESDKSAAYTVPTAAPVTTPPFFASDASIENIKIWAGHTYTSEVFPKASAVQGVDYLYKVRKATASPGDPLDVPGGFNLVNDDFENRTLQILDANKADSVAMSKTKYEYIAYDTRNSMNESLPLEFYIEVVAPTVPTAPTMVTAAEEGLTVDPVDRTVNTNKVVVNWVAPVDSTLSTFSAPHNTIPFGSPVTHYEVIQTGKISDGNPQGTPDAEYPADDRDTAKIGKDETSYTTPELASQNDRTDENEGLGEYDFQVRAVNGVGTSRPSKITDDSMALVLNPPDQPEDLRDAKEGTNPGSVILNWIEATHEGDRDGGTDDGLVTRYQITVIDPEGDRDTDHFTEELEYQVEDLDSGRHVFRVAAINSDGVGRESTSTAFTVELPAITPKNTPPQFAAGTTIESIVATAGEPISGRVLPKATDADGDTLTYSIEDAEGTATESPGGLTFNPTTRSLRGTPSAVISETEYIYKVSDGKGGEDTETFFITVNAATAGPPATSTPTTMLPANGFIVYVRDLDNPPHFGTSNPMIAQWKGTRDGDTTPIEMPNLYEFFTQGGGGSLQLNVTGVTARQVVFNEVMWAVDLGKVGQASYHGNQWIELRNRTDSAIDISNISFVVKNARPALAEGTDLISNVVGGGNAWIRTKGQNGNSANPGKGNEFISMRRSNYGVGWNAGHWTAATQVYHPNHKGTPGEDEPAGVKTFPASGVALNTVFNEIGNYPSGNSDHEWIELRIKNGDPHFENYVVDMVTGVNSQTRLFKMPKLNTGRYDKILLITKTDPYRDDSHPLRGGYNVEVDPAQQKNEGRDENIRYYVADDWNTDLPDGGEFVLILRHGSDKTNHEKVEDLAGYHPDLKVENDNFFTNLWPLIGYPAPNLTHNKIAAGQIDRRVYDDIPGTRTKDGNKADKVAFRSDNNGWTGVGYKRNANAGAQNGGTPGYANNALTNAEALVGTANPVVISEIMYVRGERKNLPQWVELRNTSKTSGINLDGWKLAVVNHDQNSAAAADTFGGDLTKTYNISGKIPPGETFLIVAHSATEDTKLPSERIHRLSNKRGEQVLNQYGFQITLKTNKDKAADTVGNLDMSAVRLVRGIPEMVYEDPAWMLPAGMNEDGDRVSMVRVSMGDNLLDGQTRDGWISFELSAHLNAPESTYYGNRNDLSNPGYTVGGPLPVSLSKFRPERLKTGAVVVRWVTESELNNAGFNILRSDALDGEFTKINTQLIKGHGTTSERNTYEFADTSAKPNVVYYYQIQDVSFDGEVTTLRTTHLRGNVTAAGKATTTWGELKALQ